MLRCYGRQSALCHCRHPAAQQMISSACRNGAMSHALELKTRKYEFACAGVTGSHDLVTVQLLPVREHVSTVDIKVCMASPYLDPLCHRQLQEPLWHERDASHLRR